MKTIYCLLLFSVVGCSATLNPVQGMKPLSRAMHSYHELHRRFPAQASICEEGTGEFSWRVAILPFVGEEALYREFKFDEPWDSSHNLKVAEKMPDVYSQLPGAGNGKTTIAMFSGPGMISGGEEFIKLRNIGDGSSNTLMLGYLKQPVSWTKPNDPPVDADSLATVFDLTLPVSTADTYIHQLDPKKLDHDAKSALLSIGGQEDVNIQNYQ